MRLIHYSNHHLSAVESRSQGEGRAADRGDKPNGLWVSVEGERDWLSWCLSEGWGLNSLSHPTEVVLRPTARLLVIATVDALLSFHREYRDAGRRPYMGGYVIDWSLVAARHQGIVIAPYQWSKRLDDEAGWYYGWDCASGCIWDADAVAELNALPVVKQTAAA